jgi:hypothetical protein
MLAVILIFLRSCFARDLVAARAVTLLRTLLLDSIA